MKRMGLVLGTVALVGLSGCATKDFVRSQADPLAERIGKLEASNAQFSAMREADTAAIKQANDKAEQALNSANKAVGDAVNANNDVKKAEAAALRAEAAAVNAEKAANEARQMAMKSEKVFKLEQKK